MANSTHFMPAYGVGIHQAIASGDLTTMKQMAEQAQKHIEEFGDVRGALAVLKAEIAKLEK